MATRDGAVCLARTFVSQGFLLHVSQVAGTCGVTGLAPASAVAHAGVVVHLFRCPGRCTAVARIAVHCGAVQQLRLRHMVGWFGQRTAVIALRHIGSTVARLTSGSIHHRVVHGHGGIEADLRFVT